MFTVMAKERVLADVIKAQILIYPATAGSRGNYESLKLYAYWNGIEKTKTGFPLLATQDELCGLPPTLIFSAEAHILRDEGEQYARQLTEAGVSVACVRVIGAVHGYITVPVVTPAYKQAMAMITYQLNEVFEKTRQWNNMIIVNSKQQLLCNCK
ncbi:hypothetical protein BDC45DRAFT_540531 [Circinella umbellata]|nr:hypothetical protein BDC45DRAFT_540531 [Circinella umbellata]